MENYLKGSETLIKDTRKNLRKLGAKLTVNQYSYRIDQNESRMLVQVSRPINSKAWCHFHMKNANGLTSEAVEKFILFLKEMTKINGNWKLFLHGEMNSLHESIFKKHLYPMRKEQYCFLHDEHERFTNMLTVFHDFIEKLSEKNILNANPIIRYEQFDIYCYALYRGVNVDFQLVLENDELHLNFINLRVKDKISDLTKLENTLLKNFDKIYNNVRIREIFNR